MFYFDRLPYSKIPIWENQYRIKYLTDFRDLLNDAFGWVRTGPAQDLEQQRIVINEGKPLVHRTIRLAGINTDRQCARHGGSASASPTLGPNVIDELWSLEALFVSTMRFKKRLASISTIKRELYFERENPVFWMAWAAETIVEVVIGTIGWIAEIPVRLLSRIFRLDQEKAVRSWYGRALTGLFVLIQVLAALFYISDYLGWKDSVLHLLRLK